jgi:hypothetical protein
LFGAVRFDESLDKSFYGQTRPISDRFDPEALAVSGFSREQHLAFEEPKFVMEKFATWLDEHSPGRPVFVFGRRIGDLYAGLMKDIYQATEWKKYRITTHTHNPVDDARGNAEALKTFRALGLKL